MRKLSLLSLLTLSTLAATGCGDRPPAAPLADPTVVPSLGPPVMPAEHLARALALGLRSPVLRAYLRAQLRASPFREHKLQFQRFLDAGGQHALHAIAAVTHTPPAAIGDTASAAIPPELYLPVPSHRVAWMGEGRVLVATALADGDVPVAFDTAGNRYLLDPKTPPTVPVLALVPVETDFTAPPSAMMCLDRCGGGGGYVPPPGPTPGVFMTQAHFTSTFEGWLKGDPEFEVHILGQKGQTDSLTDYQCAGEHQVTPYNFDQNSVDWTGSVELFSQAQLDAYRAAHPGQGVRVVVVEDDDTACLIKTNDPNFLTVVDSLFGSHTAAKDTTRYGGKELVWALALQRFLGLLASFINTNDEMVGNAVTDSIAGEYHVGFNWIVKGAQGATNGWIKLEMR